VAVENMIKGPSRERKWISDMRNATLFASITPKSLNKSFTFASHILSRMKSTSTYLIQ
jgi:hypothetical protein